MLATPSLVQYADSRTHVTGTGLLKPDTYPHVLVPREKSSARGRMRSMWPYRGRGAGVGTGLHPRRASGFVSRAGVHDASVCCLFRGVNAVTEGTSAQTTTRWRMMVILTMRSTGVKTGPEESCLEQKPAPAMEETPSFCLLSPAAVQRTRPPLAGAASGLEVMVVRR